MRTLWVLWILIYNPQLGTTDWWMEACFGSRTTCEEQAADINRREHFGGIVNVLSYCERFEDGKE